MALSFQADGEKKYRNGFNVTLHPYTLREPNKEAKPQCIFVCSMSDLFHKDIPIEFIQTVFRVMNENPQHDFVVLTKRADTLLKYDKDGLLKWASNIWAGVTVEDDTVTGRIDLLRETCTGIKALTCEPLLTSLPGLNLTGIDWVIVGGEKDLEARLMREEWVIDLRDQYLRAKIPFFFKQWRGISNKEADRLLEGRTWDQKPTRKDLILY